MAFVVQTDSGLTANANAYIDLAFFKSYMDDRNRAALYQPFTDPQIQAGIVVASDYIDTRFNFPGTRLVADSVLAATGTLTASGANLTNGDTVTIGTKVYTFQTVLTNVDGNVALGPSLAQTLLNLSNAISLQGTPGTSYALAMTVNAAGVSAISDGFTVTVTAQTDGPAGNSVATTQTIAAGRATWGGPTLAGGMNLIQTTQWPRQAGAVSGILPLSWQDINFLDPVVVFSDTFTFLALIGPDGQNIIGIPFPLKRACAEYAQRALSSGLFVDAPAPTAGPMPGRLIEEYSVTVDSITETTKYAPPQSGTFVMPAYPPADLLLARAGLVTLGRQLIR